MNPGGSAEIDSLSPEAFASEPARIALGRRDMAPTFTAAEGPRPVIEGECSSPAPNRTARGGGGAREFSGGELTPKWCRLVLYERSGYQPEQLERGALETPRNPQARRRRAREWLILPPSGPNLHTLHPGSRT